VPVSDGVRRSLKFSSGYLYYAHGFWAPGISSGVPKTGFLGGGWEGEKISGCVINVKKMYTNITILCSV